MWKELVFGGIENSSRSNYNLVESLPEIEMSMWVQISAIKVKLDNIFPKSS